MTPARGMPGLTRLQTRARIRRSLNLPQIRLTPEQERYDRELRKAAPLFTWRRVFDALIVLALIGPPLLTAWMVLS